MYREKLRSMVVVKGCLIALQREGARLWDNWQGFGFSSDENFVRDSDGAEGCLAELGDL